MKEQINFGTKTIGKNCPILVIAEIGINHEGNVNVCAEMIKSAAECGADVIKLQTVDADENYVKGTESHIVFKQAELNRDETAKIFELARSLNMEVFTTAGDQKTIDWVDKLEPAGHKISSGLLSSIPVIEHLVSKGRPILLSTGMATIYDIDTAVSLVKNQVDFALFQCTSLYPTPENDVNLSVINSLQQYYEVPVGFSDHTIGYDIPAYAVTSGAVMIEKHFTLDCTRKGFDHHIALEPIEFAKMIKLVRRAQLLLGCGEKFVDDRITVVRNKFQRCIVALKDIAIGVVFSEENIGIKRPFPGSRGIEPYKYDSILGKISAVRISADSPITDDMLRD